MTNLLHTKRIRNKTILKRYDGYIRRLPTRCFYDATGNLYYFIDEEVRGQLEIKLIESILKFDIIRSA